VFSSVPLDRINAVKAAQLAGKQDIEIVDLLEARDMHRPSRYGFTDFEREFMLAPDRCGGAADSIRIA
jgi:hypothetical protein